MCQCLGWELLDQSADLLVRQKAEPDESSFGQPDQPDGPAEGRTDPYHFHNRTRIAKLVVSMAK